MWDQDHFKVNNRGLYTVVQIFYLWSLDFLYNYTGEVSLAPSIGLAKKFV